MSPERGPASRSGWLMVAGVLQVVAMVLVMGALVELTPLTMTFSVGAAGILLGIALVIYVVTVVRELRGQSVL